MEKHTTMLVLLACSPTLLLAQQASINSFKLLGDGRYYRSQEPEARAGAAEIEETMDGLMGRLVELPPEDGSVPGIVVRFARDAATGASLREFMFPVDAFGPTSNHVLYVDPERWTYRLFTLDPADMAGDIERLSRMLLRRGSPSLATRCGCGRTCWICTAGTFRPWRGTSIDLVNAERPQRRDYCTMSALIEIDTWEPARLPVAITEIGTIAVGHPTGLDVRRHGRCWFAPRANVRWDNDLWSTTWHLVDCIDSGRQQGNTVISEVFSRGYNTDFYLNFGQYVWVAHGAKIFNNDPGGRVWYQGWAGEWGHLSSRMLTSGINITNSYTASNCF